MTVLPVRSGPLQTAAPTPTYAAASLELTVFNTINAERLNCGVGLQIQNPQLDLAASKHAEYVRLRWEEGINAGHIEDSSKSGFYVVTGSERAAKAGYAGESSGEDLSYEYVDARYNVGDRLARNLLNTVYHLRDVFDDELEVGLGVSIANQKDLPPLASLAWQTGSPKGKAQVATQQVLTYPCDGTVGVKTTFTGETPNPFAGVNMGTYASLGHPIFVFSPARAKMVVTSADITSATGAVIPSYVYTGAVDPIKYVQSWENFVVPLAALQVSTKYTVQIRGTVDGVVFAKVFQFTTGTY